MSSATQDTARLALLETGLTCDSLATLAAGWFSRFAPLIACDSLLLATYRQGVWQLVASAGAPQPLPEGLLSEAIDRDSVEVETAWAACSLEARGSEPLVLALHHASPRVGDVQQLLRQFEPTLRRVATHVREVQSQKRREVRLEALVTLAARWQTHRDLESLLVDMAQSATQLVRCDRASIFLWDKSAHTLVGRPALGIAGGELRIPDNRGLVGHVLQSGKPARVDQADDELIDHRVDKQHGYVTRTLLGVPLRARSGEMLGVFELINKQEGNFTDDDQALLSELAAHASIVLENTQERTELVTTRQQLAAQAAENLQLIGNSSSIEALRSAITRVAQTDLAVLVLGENGTGKEVVSRMIHFLSRRREKPFIAVNCAALSETLLESELFGHEKGAFTDARQTRQGKFELAAGGTLFLDEIGDLSIGGQAKLLRVLEEKVVVRVGGSTPLHTDARVIAATNQNLLELVRKKKFREDLYFRLNVVTLELPPLRERGEDVSILTEHFLEEFSRKARRPKPRLSSDAQRRLRLHPWPGNVRELRNMIERMVYLLPGETIEAEHLNLPALADVNEDPELSLSLGAATDAFQKRHIAHTIRRAGGNMSEAAQLLGLHRSNLYRKLRQLGMPNHEAPHHESAGGADAQD